MWSYPGSSRVSIFQTLDGKVRTSLASSEKHGEEITFPPKILGKNKPTSRAGSRQLSFERCETLHAVSHANHQRKERCIVLTSARIESLSHTVISPSQNVRHDFYSYGLIYQILYGSEWIKGIFAFILQISFISCIIIQIFETYYKIQV
jgi:hypothetical protein